MIFLYLSKRTFDHFLCLKMIQWLDKLLIASSFVIEFQASGISPLPANFLPYLSSISDWNLQMIHFQYGCNEVSGVMLQNAASGLFLYFLYSFHGKVSSSSYTMQQLLPTEVEQFSIIRFLVLFQYHSFNPWGRWNSTLWSPSWSAKVLVQRVLQNGHCTQHPQRLFKIFSWIFSKSNFQVNSRKTRHLLG